VALTLADILREHWASYARAHRSQLSAVHYRAVRRVLACRTPALGGHLYRCSNTSCAKKHYAYHSCNHRNCTQCGARDQQHWSAKQEAKLLNTPYFLITFTIPEQLRPLCLHQPKIFYDFLLKCSAQALTDIVCSKLRNPAAENLQGKPHQHLQPGITSVLHTWDRRAGHHPHVHSIVPAIAYDPLAKRLIHPPKPEQFLVHFRPLAARFRSLIHTALKTKHPELYAKLTPDQLRALSPAQPWNVQLQPAGSANTTVRYLARYVHRSAFHARRILGYDHRGHIKLRWTCSRTKKTAILHLHPHEFIRRWALHILPKNFTRIRHYGFHAPAAKKARIIIRLLLGQHPETLPVSPEP